MKDFAVSVIIENKYDYLISAENEDDAIDRAVEAAVNRDNGVDVDEDGIKAEGFDTDISFACGEVVPCNTVPTPDDEDDGDDGACAEFTVISVPIEEKRFEDCDADEYEPDDIPPFICDVCRHRGECSDETKLRANLRELTRAYISAATRMMDVYGQK